MVMTRAMRSVVQRVKMASVTVNGEQVGAIAGGLCVFVGIGNNDTGADADTLADKLVELRVFEDDQQKMNRSVLDVGGQVLLISQFTLFGDTRRGRRPSFTMAMEPEGAEILFRRVCEQVRQRGIVVATGRFRADMQVHLVNDGPVTLLIDTSKQF
jgi:D-aminoacyl-tRNA deacylase